MAGWKKSRSLNPWTLATDLELLESPPSGFIWQVPDEVWALDEMTRKKWFLQFDSSDEFCSIDNRWFRRGDLELPYTNRPGAWKWSVGCEVDDSVVQKYAELEDIDGSNEPRMFGKLACKNPPPPGLAQPPIRNTIRPRDHRPSLFLAANSVHPLAPEQREGMDKELYHEIVSVVIAWTEFCFDGSVAYEFEARENRGSSNNFAIIRTLAL